MLRWDGDWVEAPNGDMVRRGDSPEGRRKPEPQSWEAHRRHTTYDQRGVIETETHEAIRIKYQSKVNPRKTIGSGGGTDPHPAIAIGLGSVIHGAVFWAIMSVAAFGPSPWLALLPVLLIPLILGWKFFAVHVLVVWVFGALLIAFDGWIGWVFVLPAAGVLAPGRWIKGEW